VSQRKWMERLDAEFRLYAMPGDTYAERIENRLRSQADALFLYRQTLEELLRLVAPLAVPSELADSLHRLGLVEPVAILPSDGAVESESAGEREAVG
jgi:hypothetical protein